MKLHPEGDEVSRDIQMFLMQFDGIESFNCENGAKTILLPRLKIWSLSDGIECFCLSV